MDMAHATTERGTNRTTPSEMETAMEPLKHYRNWITRAICNATPPRKWCSQNLVDRLSQKVN